MNYSRRLFLQYGFRPRAYIKSNTVLCDNFLACECESGFDQVIFNCSFCLEETTWENITFKYSTTLNELLPNMRELLKIQDTIELTEVTKLLEKVSGRKIITEAEIEGKIEEEISTQKEIFDEIEHKITQLLSYLNPSDKEYQDLGEVAGSTILPGRIRKQGINILGRLVVAGLLAQKDDATLTVVNQSLACYLVANALVKNELSQNRARDLFRDCIEPHSVRKPIPYFSSGLDTDFSAKSTIKFQSFVMESYKFAHRQLFKFIESLAIKNKDVIQDLLKKQIPSNFIMPWVHACAYANHYNFLQILVSLESYANSIQSEEETIVLAVLYAGVPIIDLLIDKFIKKTNKQVLHIKLKMSDKQKYDKEAKDAPPPKPNYDKKDQTISLLHLAALRGNYLVMDYLINNHFKELLSQPQLRDTLYYSVIDTQYQQSSHIEERKRIIELLLHFSPTFMSQTVAHAPNIHVDLVTFLIDKGFHDECSLRAYMHFCPTYMTPQQYDRLIQALFTRGKAEIFHLTGNSERAPLHRAMENFEPLDSTIQVFSSENYDFNNGIIFTVAANKERSVRLLETLIRAGADFHKRDKWGWSVLHYAAFSYNLTALRYFIFKGCDVNASDSNKNTPLHLVLKYLRSLKTTHELVQVLLQNGADVNAIGEDDCTPLSIAVEKNKKEHLENCTYELLKNAGKS